MKFPADTNFYELYCQLLVDHPLQRATFCQDQNWTWIDTVHGDETLLLLPGFMGEVETSFLYIQALAVDMRVISVSYPPSVGRVDSLCEGLSALLDYLGIQQAAVLGGSSSGFLAQALIRIYPTRIKGLILTHTGLPSKERARTAQIFLGLMHSLPFGLVLWLMRLSVYTFFPHRIPSHAFWRDHFRGVIRRQTLESLKNRFALMADFHSHYYFQPGDLIGWSGKILLMEMSRDHLTTPAEQAAMRALYPAAILHVFSDLAHYESVESPEEQIYVIRDFLISRIPSEPSNV